VIFTNFHRVGLLGLVAHEMIDMVRRPRRILALLVDGVAEDAGFFTSTVIVPN